MIGAYGEGPLPHIDANGTNTKIRIVFLLLVPKASPDAYLCAQHQ